MTRPQRPSSGRGVLVLVTLVLVALPVRADVLPEAPCDRLPDAGPDERAWVERIAPEFAQVAVRAVPDEFAVDVFGRAAAKGWASLDVLTDDAFREPCTFYFSPRTLGAVDAAFELSLPLPIRARDSNGEAFEMAALLAGRGRLAVFYDRDAITYRNEEHDREFTLASRVDLEAPAPGTLQNVRGLCADVFLLGCVRVRSMVKTDGAVEVRLGALHSRSPLQPIRERGPRAVHEREELASPTGIEPVLPP